MSSAQPNRQTHHRTHPLLIRGIFVLLGVSVLVPWNAFISAKDYFAKRLCSDSTESAIAVLFNVASVASLGCVLLWQWLRGDSRIGERRDQNAIQHDEPRLASDDTDALANDNMPSKSKNHAYIMVMGSLTLNLAVFSLQSLLVLLPDAMNAATTDFVIYASVLFCGLTGSIANAGVVMTSSENLNYYFQGQALGGLIVSLANFMAASLEDPAAFQQSQCHNNQTDSVNDASHGALFDSLPVTASSERILNAACDYLTIDWAVFLYFVVGSLLLLGAMAGYQHVHNLRRYQYETVEEENDNDALETTTRLGLELSDPNHSTPATAPTPTSPLYASQKSFVEDTLAMKDEAIDQTDPDLASVYRLVQGPTWCIFLTFVITLAMFPGWTSQLQSQWRCVSQFRLSNDLYTPLTFVVFNAGDLTGRMWSASFPGERVSNLSTKLVAAALLRIPLALLLFTCQGATQVSGFVISLDIYSLLVQFAFAVSNGFLVTLSFAHAPRLLASSDAAAQERMSEILSFALSLGLLVGSFCSYPVSHLGR